MGTHQLPLSTSIFQHFNDCFDLLVALLLYSYHQTFPGGHMSLGKAEAIDRPFSGATSVYRYIQKGR